MNERDRAYAGIFAPPACADMTPRTFGGHWREWHRGHGCDRDPDARVVVVRPDPEWSPYPYGGGR